MVFDCRGYDLQSQPTATDVCVYPTQPDARMHDIYQGEPLFTEINPATNEHARTGSASGLSTSATSLTTVRSNLAGMSLSAQDEAVVETAAQMLHGGALVRNSRHGIDRSKKTKSRLRKHILKSKLKFVGLALGNKPIPSRVANVSNAAVQEQASLNAVRAGVMTVRVDQRVNAGDMLCVDLPDMEYAKEERPVVPAPFKKGANHKQRMTDPDAQKHRLVVRARRHESTSDNWDSSAFLFDRLVCIAAVLTKATNTQDSAMYAPVLMDTFTGSTWLLRSVMIFLWSTDQTVAAATGTQHIRAVLDAMRACRASQDVRRFVDDMCSDRGLRELLEQIAQRNGTLQFPAGQIAGATAYGVLGQAAQVIVQGGPTSEIFRAFYDQFHCVAGMMQAVQRSESIWTLGRCTRNAGQGQNTEIIFT